MGTAKDFPHCKAPFFSDEYKQYHYLSRLIDEIITDKLTYGKVGTMKLEQFRQFKTTYASSRDLWTYIEQYVLNNMY
jgi:hypothetical protein